MLDKTTLKSTVTSKSYWVLPTSDNGCLKTLISIHALLWNVFQVSKIKLHLLCIIHLMLGLSLAIISVVD